VSNFIQRAIHPVTGKTEEATWIDHGWRKSPTWTVRFPDGSEWPESNVKLPPKEGRET